MALLAAESSLCSCKNINTDVPAILSARGACAMRLTICATFTLLYARNNDSIMASALGRLGGVSSHSDYHGEQYKGKYKKGNAGPMGPAS